MYMIHRRLPALLLGLLMGLLLCVCLAPEVWADGSTVDELITAINKEETSFTLTGNMTISDSDGLIDGRYGLALTVPTGTKLSVTGGTVELSGLTLDGGTVELSGKCIFRVNDKLTYKSGKIEINSNCFNLFPAANVWPNNTGFLHYANDSLKTNLLFRAKNAAEFADALSTINGLTDRFVADLQINGRCELQDKYIFTHKVEIRVNADQGGSLYLAQDALLANNGNGGNVSFNNNSGAASPAVSELHGELNTNGLSLAPGCELKVSENGWVKTHDALYIPEGAKLTLTKGRLQLMDNSTATVGGTLENNGFINMLERSDGKPRLVINGGVYSGYGRLGVKDTSNPDSYFSGLDLTPYVKMTDGVGTQYILVDADIILPNDLSKIESEAFAGGKFQSIYIPPNVTAIAEDAFAGMSGLTIFGFPGTAAQNITGNGFTFINVG